MKKLIIIIFLLFITATSYSQVAPFGYWKTTVVGSSYEQNADSLFARMTSAGSTPSNNRKALINTTIKMIKDSLGITSLYQAFDAIWVLSARDSIQAKLNWVKDAYSLSTSNIGGTPLIFVADSGWRQNGNLDSGFIKTGYIPTSHGVKFTLTNSSMGVWLFRGEWNSSHCYIGSYSTATYTDGSWISGYGAFGGITGAMHRHNGTTSAFLFQSPLFITMGTTHVDSVHYWHEGMSSLTSMKSPYPSLAMSDCEFYMLARNQNGTIEWFYWGGISFAYTGKYLNMVESRKLYNCIKYYRDNCPSNT